jgi:hypothetical protein
LLKESDNAISLKAKLEKEETCPDQSNDEKCKQDYQTNPVNIEADPNQCKTILPSFTSEGCKKKRRRSTDSIEE